MEETIFEPSAANLDTFGENKRSLELTRGDAAMQVDTLSIVGLLAANHELVVLDSDGEIAHQKAGYREGDSQRILSELLDIVRRISVGGNFADSVERPLEVVKPQ